MGVVSKVPPYGFVLLMPLLKVHSDGARRTFLGRKIPLDPWWIRPGGAHLVQLPVWQTQMLQEATKDGHEGSSPTPPSTVALLSLSYHYSVFLL